MGLLVELGYRCLQNFVIVELQNFSPDLLFARWLIRCRCCTSKSENPFELDVFAGLKRKVQTVNEVGNPNIEGQRRLFVRTLVGESDLNTLCLLYFVIVGRSK